MGEKILLHLVLVIVLGSGLAVGPAAAAADALRPLRQVERLADEGVQPLTDEELKQLLAEWIIIAAAADAVRNTLGALSSMVELLKLRRVEVPENIALAMSALEEAQTAWSETDTQLTQKLMQMPVNTRSIVVGSGQLMSPFDWERVVEES